jgi:hypothetical protein
MGLRASSRQNLSVPVCNESRKTAAVAMLFRLQSARGERKAMSPQLHQKRCSDGNSGRLARKLTAQQGQQREGSGGIAYTYLRPARVPWLGCTQPKKKHANSNRRALQSRRAQADICPTCSLLAAPIHLLRVRSDSLPVPAPALSLPCLLRSPPAELSRGSAQWRLHQPQQPQPAAIQTLRRIPHHLWSNAFIYHLPRRTFDLSAAAALAQRAGSDSLGLALLCFVLPLADRLLSFS